MASKVIKLQNDSYTLIPLTDSNYVQYYNGTSYESTKTALDNRVKKVTSTDNAVVRFDGTGGNIQNSGVTIDDSSYVTAKKFITSGGTSSQVVLGNGSLQSAATLSQYEAYLLWGGRNLTASFSPLDAAMVSELGAPRTMFLRAAGIVIEYSRDSGTTWVDYGASDASKVALFSSGDAFYIGKSSTSGASSANYMLRVTVRTSAAYLYTVLNKFVIYVGTNGSSNCYCTIRCRTQQNYEDNVDTWVTLANQVNVSGWSGYNVINIPGTTTYGNVKASQYGEWQFIFGCTEYSGSSSGLCIYKIFGFGGVGWTTPSTMAKTGHLYSFDSSQNATFPAKVTATSLVKSGGTSSQFLKADGSVDSNQYLTSAALTSYVKKAGDTMTGTLTFSVGADGYADSFTSKGINMGNANITGVNSIFTADASDDSREGIHFYRDSSHVDSIHAKAGVLYFTPNRPLNNTGTSYPIITTNSYSSEQISIPSSVTLSNHIQYVQGQEIDFDENFANTLLGTSTTVTPAATLNNTNTTHKYWYNT